MQIHMQHKNLATDFGALTAAKEGGGGGGGGGGVCLAEGREVPDMKRGVATPKPPPGSANERSSCVIPP